MASRCSKESLPLPDIEKEENKIINTNTFTAIDVSLKNNIAVNSNLSFLGYVYDDKENTIFIINGLRKPVIDKNTIPEGEYDTLSLRSSNGFGGANLDKKEVQYARHFSLDNAQFGGFSTHKNQILVYEMLEKGDKREALKNYIEYYLK